MSDVHTVAIIGAGPGGICAAVQLKKIGIDDFVLIDRNSGVGGTWRQNDYPGLTIDVPGVAYQFSFRRNPGWSRVFPTRDEILTYHEQVAEEFGIVQHGKFDTEVVSEEWNDVLGCWEIHTSTGEVVRAQFVISAVGAFITPKEDPGIRGWQDFAGKLLRPVGWDWTYDLKGKKVAVIGTGASSVQIVPAISPKVAHLDVYQRTPAWVVPKPDFAIPPVLQRFLGLPGIGGAIEAGILAGSQLGLSVLVYTPEPVFRSASRAVMKMASGQVSSWVRSTVHDPQIAQQLVPPYGLLYKRPTLSNGFLQSFNRDNVDLITSGIDRITEGGIRTIDGVERQVDALVLATGYELFSDPESYHEGAVIGREGFDLGKFYADNRMQAYQGVMVPGLPNRWVLVGPYSWNGTGWHTLVEASTAFAISGIQAVRAQGAQSIEVTEEANQKFLERMERNNRNMQMYYSELNSGRTYYVNSQGTFLYLRPTTVTSHRREGRKLKESDYVFRNRHAVNGKRGRSLVAVRGRAAGHGA